MHGAEMVNSFIIESLKLLKYLKNVSNTIPTHSKFKNTITLLIILML